MVKTISNCYVVSQIINTQSKFENGTSNKLQIICPYNFYALVYPLT